MELSFSLLRACAPLCADYINSFLCIFYGNCRICCYKKHLQMLRVFLFVSFQEFVEYLSYTRHGANNLVFLKYLVQLQFIIQIYSKTEVWRRFKVIELTLSRDKTQDPKFLHCKHCSTMPREKTKILFNFHSRLLLEENIVQWFQSQGITV